jgi:hypothetical protein
MEGGSTHTTTTHTQFNPTQPPAGPGEHHARGARDHHEQDAPQPVCLQGPLRRRPAPPAQAGGGGQAPAVRGDGWDDHYGGLLWSGSESSLVAGPVV